MKRVKNAISLLANPSFRPHILSTITANIATVPHPNIATVPHPNLDPNFELF